MYSSSTSRWTTNKVRKSKSQPTAPSRCSPSREASTDLKERIEKYLRPVLERNAVPLGIELGFVLIPAESDTSQLVFDVH